jgi:hypothetical protein
MHKCKRTVLRWGREGGVNFFLKETLLTSATNIYLTKKRSRFGNIAEKWISTCYLRSKKQTLMIISQGLNFLTLRFFLKPVFPDALIFGFTIAFNSFFKMDSLNFL